MQKYNYKMGDYSEFHIRKRATNFSSKEELILSSIIQKYKDVLECRSHRHTTHSQKLSCWVDIEREFNNISDEIYRSKEVLRKKYENTKKRAKKKIIVPNRDGEDSLHKQIHASITDSESKQIVEPKIEISVTEFHSEGNSKRDYEQERYLPGNQIRLSEWPDIRPMSDPSKHFLLQEQELKLRLMREKHELELSMMREKANLELELLREEHRLKMDILLLEKAELRK